MTFSPCPCCRYKTLSTGGPFEICPVCYWEDDWVQSDDPTYEGGANDESLEEARRNFETFGASSPSLLMYVRPPTPEEEKNR
jgi:hypothetical protein